MRDDMPGKSARSVRPRAELVIEEDEPTVAPSSNKKPKRRILKPTFADAAPILQEVDDTEERTTRNLHRLMEQATKFSSPQGTPERRKSIVSSSGMTNMQIVEHYSNCLKLSAENKINLKNAFDLHLIDLMGPVLNKDPETNFQAAGSTLDASAKIYAYRVDCLYKETYKIAGGLGRSDKNDDNDDEPAQTSGGGAQGPTAKETAKSPDIKKRKKKHVKGSCIETNEKALNMIGSEAKFETDELFENVRASFEEGNSSGLFSNTLCTISDNNRLILHSLCDIPISLKLSPLIVECKRLKEILISAESAFKFSTACPPLANFSFRKLDTSFGDADTFMGDAAASTSKSKTFAAKNIDADTAADLLNDPDHRLSLPQEFERDMQIADDDDFFDDDQRMTTIGGDKREEPSPALNGSSCKNDDFDAKCRVEEAGDLEEDLRKMIPEVLQTWMGPNHWRLRKFKRESGGDSEPVSPSRASQDNVTGKKKVSKKRRLPAKRKADERVNFDEDVHFANVFKFGRASTVLSNSTLAKYKDHDNAFEPDVEVEMRDFSGLFLKPGFKISKSSHSPNASLDDTLPDYNLDNPVDEQNFCPDSQEVGGGHNRFDQDRLEISFADAGGDEGEPMTAEDGGGHVTHPEAGDATISEQTMIEQPYKINKIDINYAKQAKRIDVRQLKKTIWQILTSKKDEKAKTSLGPQDSPSRMSNEVLFSRVCEELPSRVSPQLASNLTPHTMFTVLLHMCNEKNLTMEGSEDFSDVKITQD